MDIDLYINAAPIQLVVSGAQGPASEGGGGDVAGETHAAASKTTPADADELPLVDSEASNVLKKLTWANVKATLKTYFDTLYATVAALAGKQTASANLDTWSGVAPGTGVATALAINVGSAGAFAIGNQDVGTTASPSFTAVSLTGTGILTLYQLSGYTVLNDSGNGLILNYDNPSISVGIGSSDSGISRLGSAGLAIGNGAAGDFSGSLKLATLISTGKIRLPVFTVATLPAASLAAGDTAAVSDALAPTFLATVVGGGAIYCIVSYDGTNWKAA